MSCASCGALGLETSRLLINPGSASAAQCLHCPESDLLLQSSEMTRCAITGRKQLQQIAALFDRLVAWTSNVGEIVMRGTCSSPPPLLDQICPHSQIQNQTTGYSNRY